MTDRPQHPGTPEERAERLRAIRDRWAGFAPWVKSTTIARDDGELLLSEVERLEGQVARLLDKHRDYLEVVDAIREERVTQTDLIAALERERDEALAALARHEAWLLPFLEEPWRFERSNSFQSYWTCRLCSTATAVSVGSRPGRGEAHLPECPVNWAALAGTAAPRPQEEKQNDV